MCEGIGAGNFLKQLVQILVIFCERVETLVGSSGPVFIVSFSASKFMYTFYCCLELQHGLDVFVLLFPSKDTALTLPDI